MSHSHQGIIKRVISTRRKWALGVADDQLVATSTANLTRSTSSSASILRDHSASSPKEDFQHHKPGVARLNHASFGAVPAPVLKVQEEFRRAWLAQPDEMYFSGKLHESVRNAALVAGTTLVPKNHKQNSLDPEHVCLVENSTSAACAVAYRWSKLMEQEQADGETVVLYLNVVYKACQYVLQEHCGRRGGVRLVPLEIPFLAPNKEIILQSIEEQLIDLTNTSGVRIRFAFLDHVSSQPAVLLPLKEMIALIRQYSTDDCEVCVDAAHAVGSIAPDNLNVLELDCDFYFSNLHKWGFAPPGAAVFWSPKLPEMEYPIVSWAWGQGMATEMLYTGTRDYSPFLTVPAAVEYLQTWRDKATQQNSAEYCHERVIEAAKRLRRDWAVDNHAISGEMDDSLIATQAMIKLPHELVVDDVPGQVSRGVRDILRDDYKIEAAVGNFGRDKGAYLRLSWAVYNEESEIQRLSDAVIDIIENQ